MKFNFDKLIFFHFKKYIFGKKKICFFIYPVFFTEIEKFSEMNYFSKKNSSELLIVIIIKNILIQIEFQIWFPSNTLILDEFNKY